MPYGEIAVESNGPLKTVPRGSEAEHQRILLFVAPPGSISDALAAAVEREFKWISVRIVPDVALARAQFGAVVQLILIDMIHLDEVMHRWRELEEAHPSAFAAITASRCAASVDALKRAAEKGAIRGVVPMDVNLDIWLSVIRIMLKGGEYFPPELFQRNLPAIPAPSVEEPPGAGEAGEAVPRAVKGLTGRELEVLSCVAKGLQNKLIAAELGLSENTVKIHIHNIIRKLGAHNRTEVAALYFRCAAGESASPKPEPGGLPT